VRREGFVSFHFDAKSALVLPGNCMLATRPELIAAADELDAGLRGAIVQRVYSPAPLEAWLEVRQPGRSTLLCVCARAGAERFGVADERPPSPKQASGFQQRLRKLLTGQKLEGVLRDGLYFTAHALKADFEQHRLELVAPMPVPEREAPQPSEYPLARALEARVATVVVDTEAQERAARVKKLRRTRAKVAEEAERGPASERMKLDGELLARNLQAVPRGAKSVKLTEYGPEGEAEREVKLDPKRTPKQQVEWLFHQYKRLQRGSAIAQERLRKLDDEIRALEEGAALPQRSASAPKDPQAPSLPFREYTSSTGKRIWVGKGAKHNDALTFRHARPHHLWLHARGVPGAHVVVVLEKKESVDQETLLDAAHLALHHSDMKGERTGEVSYTHVKYVRKSGDAPGAVTYTHDATFWLRVEPQRLDRLVAT
jgi:predicted ribosome quality control (RQC) complex YloA/Tae2 family protein